MRTSDIVQSNFELTLIPGHFNNILYNIYILATIKTLRNAANILYVVYQPVSPYVTCKVYRLSNNKLVEVQKFKGNHIHSLLQ